MKMKIKDNLKPYLIALGAILCLVAVKIIRDSKTATVLPNSDVSAENPASRAFPSTPTQQAFPFGTSARTTSPSADSKVEVPLTPREAASREVAKEFASVAKLDNGLPGDMTYTPLDLDDNVAGVYGVNTVSGAELAAFAYAGKATVNDVRGYLTEIRQALPNLANQKVVSEEPPVPVKAVPGSGLKDVQLWSMRLGNGEQAYIALAPREDNRGTYVFLMTAPRQAFEDNEGFFELFHSKLKALPPDSP